MPHKGTKKVLGFLGTPIRRRLEERSAMKKELSRARIAEAPRRAKLIVAQETRRDLASKRTRGGRRKSLGRVGKQVGGTLDDLFGSSFTRPSKRTKKRRERGTQTIVIIKERSRPTKKRRIASMARDELGLI